MTSSTTPIATGTLPSASSIDIQQLEKVITTIRLSIQTVTNGGVTPRAIGQGALVCANVNGRARDMVAAMPTSQISWVSSSIILFVIYNDVLYF